jgi:glycosyltransferase involved in cell wall biosynthesis
MTATCASSADLRARAARPLDIAVVTETWPPEVNGVAVTLALLVQSLRQRGHRVQLVRTRQHVQENAAAQPGFHEVLTAGVPIPRYPHLRMGLPCRQRLRSLWSAHRPDIVHIATEGPLGWSALRAARHLGLPVTSDFRTNFHGYCAHYGVGWLRAPIEGYLRHFHNLTRRTTVPTVDQRRQLSALGLNNLQVVARGVDTARFHASRRSLSLRQSWGAVDDDLVVACVGRLAAEKNLSTMVAAFNAIAERDARAHLVVVGDGPLRDELRRTCRGKVVFAGQRTGEDLAAHYASADMLLFPSLTETFGNVTTEAMASGLPVVAYDLAAAGQLIRPGANGMLAPAGDARRFVAAALMLAADPQARRAMGAMAAQAVVGLGWPAVARRFEAMLMQVLQEHGGIAACKAGGTVDAGWRRSTGLSHRSHE